MDKIIEMSKRTRFKISLAAMAFLVLTTYVAMILRQEIVATSCIAGLMTVLSAYIWAETRRPSQIKTDEKG
jgi:hypothetical protein